MATSTITNKGQTTVPATVREQLGWEARQRLVWEPRKDGTATVRPVASVMELAGALRGNVRFPGLAEETDAATRAWAARATKGKRR